METLTVVCLELGNYLGRGQEYVAKLASMCGRHLPRHRFCVISDRDVYGDGTVRIPSEPIEAPDAELWWQKLQVFRPGLFTGPTLYLDLDVVISGDCAGLVALLEQHPGLWALDDFAWPISTPRPIPLFLRDEILPLLGGPGTVNSSVMLWRDEAAREVWDRYSPQAAAGLHGDQNWITRCLGREGVQLIPSELVVSRRFGGTAPVTVWHGEPKPHECPDDPMVAEHWR